MTDNHFDEIKRDIQEIKKYLLGNGRPGLMDRMQTLEVMQANCPARNSLLTDERAVRVQKFAALVSVACVIVMIITLFMGVK